MWPVSDIPVKKHTLITFLHIKQSYVHKVQNKSVATVLYSLYDVFDLT